MAGLYSNYASASPADIQLKREIQQRLLMNAQQTQPQTIGEGLGAVGDYIYAGRVGRAADEKDKALSDKVAQALSPIMGGSQPVAPATPGMPSASVEPVQITNIPPPGYSDSVTVGGDGMGDIAPPAQMPQQRQPQMQAADDGRMDFAEVDTETLRRTYEKIAADPDLVDAIDFKRPGFFKRAGEELQRRYEYGQNAPDRRLRELQIQAAEQKLNQAPDAPTVQKITQSDGSEVLVQWDGKQWVPLNAPQGGRAVGDRQKLTESQSKLTLFQSMQTETQPFLLDMETQFDPANVPDAAARLLPGGNFWASEQAQMYDSAATAWAEGALRIATGAAATPEEMERTKRAYFAQPGDSPATVKFKAQMREMYNRSIQRALGFTNTEGALPKPSDFARQFQQSDTDLQPGTVEDGYRYKGGNPADPNSWEKVL